MNFDTKKSIKFDYYEYLSNKCVCFDLKEQSSDDDLYPWLVTWKSICISLQSEHEILTKSHQSVACILEKTFYIETKLYSL